MITLNGYSFQFACAAGALGFDGRGWWWEKPLRWAGLIDPSKFLVITKSLTWEPRVGNLKMWCPWRCVRLLPGDGAVNAVGLTNGGFPWWVKRVAPFLNPRWRYVVSIVADDEEQAAAMARGIDCAADRAPIVGVEVNLSCPSAANRTPAQNVAIARAALAATRLPIMVKVGGPSLRDVVGPLDGEVVWDMINTVPWDAARAGQLVAGPSPLAKYGLTGGVSGGPIWAEAEGALRAAKAWKVVSPILSGGGVMGYGDVQSRFRLGAAAVAFGTLFLRRPWEPNQCIARWEREHV